MTQKLTKQQQHIYCIMQGGSILIHFKASSVTHSSFSLDTPSGFEKIHQKIGKSLISSGLIEEFKRIEISEHRARIYYKSKIIS